ncbi:MAG: hypothetical protein Q9169_003610 [Polycauliona sp. 2 TL-2023]
MADHGQCTVPISNKELATLYFTDGYEVAGVKPGSLLWQPSRAETDAPQNILPRNEEMQFRLLRGVERVFEKLERYARDKRTTHSRTTSTEGHNTVMEDDVGCPWAISRGATSTGRPVCCLLLLIAEQDDDLPDILELLDPWKNTVSPRGQREKAQQAPQHCTPAAGNHQEDSLSGYKDQNSDAMWDPLLAGIPLPTDNQKDEEYEPSIRLTDEPRRLPTTRKEIERRKQLPLSQRSCESTLVPMEEAFDCVNKRKRKPCPKSGKSCRTSKILVAEDGHSEEQGLVELATSMGLQTPSSRKRQSNGIRPFLSTPDHTPSGAEDDVTMGLTAAKRQRLQESPHAFESGMGKHVLDARPRPTRMRSPTRENCPMPIRALSFQSGIEVPDSPSCVHEDDLDGTLTNHGDNTSQIEISPTSPHSHNATEQDDGELYDVSTRETSIQREDSAAREESIELGSGSAKNETDAERDSASDATSLPPNIWILAPNRSWVCWDKTLLDSVTISQMSDEVKSQMGLEHVADLTMRFSDRKESWTIVLRSGQELRHQDIKAMVVGNPRIRDVYYFPAM